MYHDIPNVLGNALLLKMVGNLGLKLLDGHCSPYLQPLEEAHLPHLYMLHHQRLQLLFAESCNAAIVGHDL
jgi:hypothetical protein